MHSFRANTHLIIQTIRLCKNIIFRQGSKKVCGRCNPDPSSPCVWAKAEQFPSSCQSDTPHYSVVFIADETAPVVGYCHVWWVQKQSAKNLPAKHTQMHKHAHTLTFTISKGLWRMTHSLPCPGKERVSKDNGWNALPCSPLPQN